MKPSFRPLVAIRLVFVTFGSLSLAIAQIGCSSAQKTKPQPSLASDPKPHAPYQRSAGWDLIYTVGHDIHRLSAEIDRPDVKPQAQAYVDHELVDTHVLSESQNDEILERIKTFVQSHREPASAASCRSPYSLSLQLDENRFQIKGCRLGTEGSQISRLVRDIEFLVYSKN